MAASADSVLIINTKGGGLSYTHTGMYGMFALQESVRQMRGTAAAQVGGAFLAIGSAISALSKNQVIAFIVAAAICFLFVMSGVEIVHVVGEVEQGFHGRGIVAG